MTQFKTSVLLKGAERGVINLSECGPLRVLQTNNMSSEESKDLMTTVQSSHQSLDAES